MAEQMSPPPNRAGNEGYQRYAAQQQYRSNTRAVNGASYQEYLAQIVGYYIICELLMGVDQLVLRQGTLVEVGESYFTLYDEDKLSYTVCDIYSLKFVTRFYQGNRPTTEEFMTWLRDIQATNNIAYGAPVG